MSKPLQNDSESGTISVVSGGFDPIHVGHIRYIKAASLLGRVVVLLNSDPWLIRKKTRFLMDWHARKEILEAMSAVQEVRAVEDDDGTVIAGLVQLLSQVSGDRLIFCNGGDRSAQNTPEALFCEAHGIRLVYGVGGDKVQSSSAILQGWTQ